MPLSKARDRARKNGERARARLEKLLCPPQALNPVQPKPAITLSGAVFDIYDVELDADGNPIYEES